VNEKFCCVEIKCAIDPLKTFGYMLEIDSNGLVYEKTGE
jgi:hypothetical protein